MRRYSLLMAAFALTLILPFIGSYLKFGGPPPGYGDFPAQLVDEPPGFNQTFFLFGCGVAISILIFLLFPRWFGFKKSD